MTSISGPVTKYAGLRQVPAWRAMFARLDAKARAAREAEARRWRALSDDEKFAEAAAAVTRWRRR